LEREALPSPLASLPLREKERILRRRLPVASTKYNLKELHKRIQLVQSSPFKACHQCRRQRVILSEPLLLGLGPSVQKSPPTRSSQCGTSCGGAQHGDFAQTALCQVPMRSSPQGYKVQHHADVDAFTIVSFVDGWTEFDWDSKMQKLHDPHCTKPAIRPYLTCGHHSGALSQLCEDCEAGLRHVYWCRECFGTEEYQLERQRLQREDASALLMKEQERKLEQATWSDKLVSPEGSETEGWRQNDACALQ